jgi:hypothetical protein
MKKGPRFFWHMVPCEHLMTSMQLHTSRESSNAVTDNTKTCTARMYTIVQHHHLLPRVFFKVEKSTRQKKKNTHCIHKKIWHGVCMRHTHAQQQHHQIFANLVRTEKLPNVTISSPSYPSSWVWSRKRSFTLPNFTREKVELALGWNQCFLVFL